MKILFACGGTAGHINPALAMAGVLRQRHPEAVVKFAGNPHGMEARLVPAAGYEFLPIEVMGIQRQLNWRNIRYNVRSVGCLALSGGRAKKILQSFQPDLVVGTGGYVSGPMLRKAHQLGYRTLTHEQNAFPGVTTKLLCRHVDMVLLAGDKAREYLHQDREYVVTGNPVRGEILTADRAAARRILDIGDELGILSFGGSLGAARVNEAVADVIAWHRGRGIHHIHATGAYGVDEMPRLLEQRGVDYRDNPAIDIREYINDMPNCLAAADLVIGRAGAITLSELQAAGRASILIPSPNVAENHQYHNAMVLQRAGAAVVIEEKDLTGGVLVGEVRRLTEDQSALEALGRNAGEMAILDANERIYREMMELVKRR